MSVLKNRKEHEIITSSEFDEEEEEGEIDLQVFKNTRTYRCTNAHSR